MKKIKIIYWICTGLFGAVMFFSGIQNMLVTDDSVKMLTNDLGYPTYLIPFIGAAKILGVIGILVPGFPRVTEWAYAGLFFDLIGATYSIIALGTPFASWAGMLPFFVIGGVSYIYYHKKLKASVDLQAQPA
jgi:hypothetical protein